MTNDQLHELAYLRFLMKENITKLESRRDNARTLLNELDEKFETTFSNLISDESLQKELSQNIKSLAKPNATKDIVEEIIKLIK